MRSIVHFSSIKAEIIKSLKNAVQEIKGAVAWLTDEDIIRTLTQKAEAGLNVHFIISDSKENFRTISKFSEFLKSGGKLYVATPKFLHNKFCIIDRNIILNGSYNWTYFAQNNEENILVINLDNTLEDDKRFLKSFEAKHKYLCDKASANINDSSELLRFRQQDKDISAMLAKLDEEEIKLRQELEDDVKKSFNQSRALGIGVSDYLLERMRIDGGGVELIKRILHDEISSGEMKSGFRKLEEPIPHRVDLSLEYLASRPKYTRLFSDNEITFCKGLMKKYNL